MRTLEVMPILAEKGISFHFCTLGVGSGELDEIIRKEGGTIHNCSLRQGYFLFAKNFYQLLRDGQYNIVHSHVHYFSGKIVEIAHRANIPKRIVHFRTLYDGKVLNWRRRIYHAYMKFLINRHATNILAVCQGAMEHSWSRFRSDPRCKVIYNGINLQPFKSVEASCAAIRKEMNIEDGKKVLINVGNFYPAKAHDILLQALSIVLKRRQDILMLLVGDGVLKSQMEQLAESLGISEHVRFLGKRSDVPALLKASDCYILSSRREGLPGSVLEALAAGLPIVATELPGVREIAQHTSNIKLVPAEDSGALALEILRVLQNLDSQQFISAPFPSVFDLLSCAENLSQIYLG